MKKESYKFWIGFRYIYILHKASSKVKVNEWGTPSCVNLISLTLEIQSSVNLIEKLAKKTLLNYASGKGKLILFRKKEWHHLFVNGFLSCQRKAKNKEKMLQNKMMATNQNIKKKRSLHNQHKNIIFITVGWNLFPSAPILKKTQ